MLVHWNFNIEVTKILYYWFLLLHSFNFCESYFTTHQRFVANKSAISTFVGGTQERNNKNSVRREQDGLDLIHRKAGFTSL